MRAVVICALISVLPRPAIAGEGVTEISQAKAVAGAVTPGDAPGFPVTLSQRGSYRLTSNLEVSGAGVRAIDVTVSSVAIDLGGFSIRGPANCLDGCTVTNSEPGIQALVSQVSVRNGMIRGFAYAIRAEDDSHVEEVIATSNSSGGFLMDRRCKFLHNVVADNNGNGIDADRGSVVVENLLQNNEGAGIRLRGEGSVVTGNLARLNAAFGIRCGLGCEIGRNLASSNASYGISTDDGSLVEGNLAYNNGPLVAPYAVQISLGPTSGFTNNVVFASGPGGGKVIGGVFMAPNLCQGQATEAACRP